MSKKRKEIPWKDNVVGNHDDLEEALEALKTADIKWKMERGGEKGSRRIFCCLSHQACKVRCRVVLQRDGSARVYAALRSPLL